MRSGVSKHEERTKFTFFWNGTDILSQWYIAKFQVENVWYNCAEQYMMHQKAGEYVQTPMDEMCNPVVKKKCVKGFLQCRRNV